MISNKPIITLTLIILNIKYVASTSPSDPSKKRVEKAISHLQDKDNQVADVPVEGGTPVQVDQVDDQSIPVINEHFKRLIGKKHDEIMEHIEMMGKDVFITQICPVVKTYKQFKNLKSCFEQHKMIEHFYVYGDMTVVKDAIIIDNPFRDFPQPEEVRKAIGLALEGDKHERVCELLKARQEGTAERDKNCGKGYMTSFEVFMRVLFRVLAFWKNIKPLARFFTFYGKEFSDKYPDIYSIFCKSLVDETYASSIYGEPDEIGKAKKLLNDLVGQPSLLTPVTFSQGFFYSDVGFWTTAFIENGWQDSIKEGLSRKYGNRGEHLWNYLMEEYPVECSGNYPPSEEALDAVLKLFLTKEEREEAWNKAHAPILSKKLENLNHELNLFPTVLWTIISEYNNAPSWSDVC